MLSKTTHFIRTGVAAAVVGSALAAAPAAQATGELSASASVANMYLWRGLDLGDGSAAVSGDLTYSIGGAYAGIWVSSGDDALGNEYDYYVGYGTEMGDFSFDISLWNYNYSDNGLAGKGFDVSDDTTGELSEIITTVGFKGISLSYYDNIAGATGYEHWTLSGGVGKVSFTEQALAENVHTIVDAVSKAKPAGAKDTYIKRISLSSTMGPSIRLDVAGVLSARSAAE